MFAVMAAFVNTLLTFSNYPFSMAILDFPTRPFPLVVNSQSGSSSSSIRVFSIADLSAMRFEPELSLLILKKTAREGDPPESVALTLDRLMESLENGLRASQLQILGYELEVREGWFDLIVVIDTVLEGKSN